MSNNANLLTNDRLANTMINLDRDVFSQAPASMKSVVQAAWLLTVAFGNLIVVIVADLEIFKYQVLLAKKKERVEKIAFCALCVAALCLLLPFG